MNDINIENAPTTEAQNQGIFFADGVANNSFVKESNAKIGILTFLFSVFYPIGYFYKQWKAIKKNNAEYKNISPFWRGVFYPFYAFKFTKIVDNLLKTKKTIFLSVASNAEEKQAVESEYNIFKQYYSNSYFIFALPITCIMIILLPIPDGIAKPIGTGIYIAMIITLCNLQKGINKVLPENHPTGKLTFSDFMGIPITIGAILIFAITTLIFTDPCINIKGNILTDTCDNYSIVFPFENQKVVRRGIGHYCQSKTGLSNKDLVCVNSAGFPFSFQQDVIAKEIEKLDNVKVISSKTASYNDNLGYCFSVEKDEPYKNICFMQFKDKPNNGIIATSKIDEGLPFENLEKTLNSYKKL